MRYVTEVINIDNEREIYDRLHELCGRETIVDDRIHCMETTVGYKILGGYVSKNMVDELDILGHDEWCVMIFMTSAYEVSERRLMDVIEWSMKKDCYSILYTTMLEGVTHYIDEYRVQTAGVLKVLEKRYGVTKDKVYECMQDSRKRHYDEINSKVFIEDV